MAVSKAVEEIDLHDLRVGAELPNRLPRNADLIRHFIYLKSKTSEKNEQSVSKLAPVIAKAVCEIWTQLWPKYLSHLLQSFPHVLTKVQRVLNRAKCVTASQIKGSIKDIMTLKEDSKKLFSLLSCR